MILTPVQGEDPVQDKELDSLLASEKRIRFIGLAAVFSLLTLTGMLLWWAFA
jgi:hypothetical protein